MTRVLSPAVCDRLRRLCAMHSDKTVAEITGIPANTIGRVRRRNFEPRTFGTPRPPRPDDFAIQANHMTVHEMVRHYRVHGSTIRIWLKGVDRQYQPKPHPDNKKHAPDRAVIVQALTDHGVHGAALALDVSRDTLRRWRKELGLPIRPHSMAKKRAAAAEARGLGWAERQAERLAA